VIKGTTISLVIPCHNEAPGLAKILPQVPPEVDEVVVVDNNSTDGTGDIARQYGGRVITETRPGYGQAYQAGFAEATGNIIVTLDGDGQYPIQDISRLLNIFLDRNLDFLSACRFPLVGDAMPPLRRVGNRVLTGAAALLFGTAIKDTQSGMWIFWRKNLSRINPTQPGMAFSEEIKLKALSSGLKFGEEHIVYLPREGESKLAPWHDGISNLLYLIKLRFTQ
jgi:glycosyltransferase involved in cell wall biosynthesis